MSQSNPPNDGSHSGATSHPTDTITEPPGTIGTKGKGSAAHPPVLPRQIGRFEIRQLLGEGAFGRVYLGFDPQLGRQVAIKVPHRKGLTPEFRDRFLREARATALIHHPNVCPVHDVGTAEDLPYMVMHYVVGGTLSALINKHADSLEPHQAVIIARKIALGIAAAHAQGVIHRDLKPQNVLFDKDNREVLITDFGLARIGAEGTLMTAGKMFGTPAYMSPEQVRGNVDEIGPLSDIYSLGVILYRMLAGEIPFQGTVAEVMSHHAKTNPRPPSSIRSTLHPKLDAIVLKAMAKQPSDRFPSAKAFADTLSEFLKTNKQAKEPEPAPLPQPESNAELDTTSNLPAVTEAIPRQKNIDPVRERRTRLVMRLLMFFACLAAATSVKSWIDSDPKNPPRITDKRIRMYYPPPEPKAAPPVPKPKLDPEKLIGKWNAMVVGKGSRRIIGTWHFTRDKHFIATADSDAELPGGLGPVSKAPAGPWIFSLEGDKLALDGADLAGPGSPGGTRRITYTVLKLTDDELLLANAANEQFLFAKVSPKDVEKKAP